MCKTLCHSEPTFLDGLMKSLDSSSVGQGGKAQNDGLKKGEKMEQEKIQVEEVNESKTPSPKKNLKWLWITIALVVLAGVAAWVIYNGVQNGVKSVFGFSAFLFGMFVIVVLGYMLGRITIKGVNLGTAGVFLVAILFGLACTYIPADTPIIGGLHLETSSVTLGYYKGAVSNIGLVLFVGSVGFIAGPKFFRNFAKNFKTYILMGAVIILVGAMVAVCFALIPGINSDFSAGILSGALTSTPGYSSALEAAKAAQEAGRLIDPAMVTLGYALAYPFGVVGVVLFVQLMPKILKADMNYERSLIKPEVLASREENSKKKLIECDDFGLVGLAVGIVLGLLVGAIKIPLFKGVNFTLGTTGGVLIMCLVCGHFGRIGRISLEVPTKSAKVLRELGLMLFLIGSGVDGGVNLISQIQANGGAMIVVWGLLAGVIMTTAPMIVGLFLGRKVLKLPLLNSLGSITGGMTSTPALGTLISSAETEDVASSYASTYPIALIMIVLACNLIIGLI